MRPRPSWVAKQEAGGWWDAVMRGLLVGAGQLGGFAVGRPEEGEPRGRPGAYAKKPPKGGLVGESRLTRDGSLILNQAARRYLAALAMAAIVGEGRATVPMPTQYLVRRSVIFFALSTASSLPSMTMDKALL